MVFLPSGGWLIAYQKSFKLQKALISDSPAEADLERIFEDPIRPPAWSSCYGAGRTAGLVPPGAGRAGDLVARLTRRPPAEAEALVAFGCLWLDDRPCLEPDRSLAGHVHFRVSLPAYGPVRFYEADPGRIIHEDDDLLVYHKEAGRPSQGVPYDAHNNVLAALGRLVAGRGGGGGGRLWLPHRLDAETSGLLLLAKNQAAAGAAGRAFQTGRVAKGYLALGLGPRPERASFQVEAAIAKEGSRYVARAGGPGRPAKTNFTVLARRGFDESETGEVLFRAEPLTGRTHQIRLHLAHAGWPVRGDLFYGRAGARAEKRLMLAAVSLGLDHPGRPGRLEVSLEPLR